MPTGTKTTILAIRHGQTVWNAEKRYQGYGDSPLTEIGRNQASALGRRLKRIQIDKVISSDLGRAQETASFVADHTGHAVEIDSRLRERNYGVLEGLTVPEIKTRYADVLNQLDNNDPDYLVPEGESRRQHYHRIVSFMEEIITKRSGAIIAVVAHGGVLDCIFRNVAHLPLKQPRCFIITSASLANISHGNFYGTVRWVINSWGDTGHLDGIGTAPDTV